MSRYVQACERMAWRLKLGLPGVALVLVPPGEQAVVAHTLATKLENAPVSALGGELLLQGPPCALVPGIPRERKAREQALTELNGRRDWLSRHERCLVLLLDRYELADLQRLAGDVYAAKLFLETVPFEPAPGGDPEKAREALAQWQRKRFGRLDLRGFIRDETEDVSWPIEDIYQEMKATHWKLEQLKVEELVRETHEPLPEVPLIQALEASSHESGWRQPVVILGHPGSGKTFFLRWLAMRAATQASLWGIGQPLPLLLSLPAHAQTPGPLGLLEYAVEALSLEGQPAAHEVARAVAEKRAIFLLDGLDEVGNAAARHRALEAVHALMSQAPGCPVLITSRIAGYEAPLTIARHFILTPFDDAAIRQFLSRWCGLYAQDRLGRDAQVQAEGQEEGRRLAQDVLANPSVRDLARSPLLLTVLAIVHRTGVRLPEHRVELYEHATRILVERWNRLRSLSGATGATPLKAADAVRLLGPVALQSLRSGKRGAIQEESLRELLGHALADQRSLGSMSPEQLIEFFRGSLGLLIERGPGLFAFLHLTLAEYFAAWELVRSGELERLAADPKETYVPEWREVLRLAAGILGIIQAADRRLSGLIEIWVNSDRGEIEYEFFITRKWPLLGGILVDDPGLSRLDAQRLIHACVMDSRRARITNPVHARDLDHVLRIYDSPRHHADVMTQRIKEGRFGKEFESELDELENFEATVTLYL